MAQLCVTIGAPTLADLRERRDKAARDADLVELRLDTVADPDVAGALAGRTRPGDRHLPRERGKAGTSAEASRSGCACCTRPGPWAPSTSTSSLRP